MPVQKAETLITEVNSTKNVYPDPDKPNPFQRKPIKPHRIKPGRFKTLP